MFKSQTIIKECTVVANGLVTHFTLRNVGPGTNMSGTETLPKMWIFSHGEMGSSSIWKLKKWYHFVSTKSEKQSIYSSVQQPKQQGYICYKLCNCHFAKMLVSTFYRRGNKNILQAGHSSPGSLTSPSSGLTSSPSARAWHCCLLSCFHSGPQQLPAEGFW